MFKFYSQCKSTKKLIMENSWSTPKKHYLHNHFDSSRWNSIRLRNTDIIISTYPKSGTTREQMTFLQLLHKGEPNLNITELSPYIELCIEPISEIVVRVENQKNRRVLKGHLPLDYLPFNDDIQYVDIWRSPFDVAISLFHHHNNANKKYFEAINLNKPQFTEDFKKNNLTTKEWIIKWFETDGFPYWSYSKHINTWWKYRKLKNVHIFHYADLSKEHRKEILKRANILNGSRVL